MKFKNLLKLLKAGFVVTILAILAGCAGDSYTINTGEVGRIMDSNGLSDEILTAKQGRLENCWESWGEVCEKMSVLSAAKATRSLNISRAFLPKSDIPLDDIQMDIQFMVLNDTSSMNYVWNNVRAKQHEMNSRIISISSDAIFDSLIKGPAASLTIDLLKDYDIDQVLGSVVEISEAARARINKSLREVGVAVTRVDFPNGLGNPPETVLLAKERLYAVKADKARELAEIEAQIEIEAKRQTFERTRADNNIEIWKKVIESKTGVTTEMYNWQQTAAMFADNGVPFALGIPLLPSK